MRRPARGREEEVEEDERKVVEEHHPLASLTMAGLKGLDIIELGETSHYGGHVKIAGRVCSLRPSEEEMDFELTGTLTDKVLERYGGGGDRKVRVHVCPVDCAQLSTGDRYFHARGYWNAAVAPKPWHTNLVPEKGKASVGRGGEAPPKAVEKEAKVGKRGARVKEEREEEKEEGAYSGEGIRRAPSNKGGSRRVGAGPEDSTGSFRTHVS